MTVRLAMRRLLRAFGRDAFRVELQRPFHRHDRALMRAAADKRGRVGVSMRLTATDAQGEQFQGTFPLVIRLAGR